ncbi:Extended Signal Peptide of Type V secretion system [Paraburkholderia steynii]|uniref:Extended Signal Peptide of Type V secretion system n=1 Tax=Paraburkholderia steynii TaxID=1245441 RepID=A0A7Z7FL58_9BURK|nr:ESPR-type extended signal peptide-containing protein [Paraburkholderia steynii]SDI65749.1 Extended Signal Peptide of Type V secretion system [Paraburkholderia steynii]
MNRSYRSVWNASTNTWTAVQENAKGRTKKSTRSTLLISAVTSLIGVAAATPAWASSIANNFCTPTNAGSGTWSNVAGCFTDAGAYNSLHNLGETVYGSYGYVPTNISFATIMGFAGQVNSLYGTALGANGVVTGAAQNSVALGAGSVATDPNTVSVGRVGNNPLYNVNVAGSDPTSVDATPMNQSLLGTLTRRITNMAAGINSTDAVNVSQLQGVTNALGGGAGINSTTGAVTAPTFVVGNNTYNNVSGAISDLNGRMAGGNKYFHANSGAADSLASGQDSLAVGPAQRQVVRQRRRLVTEQTHPVMVRRQWVFTRMPRAATRQR